MEQTKIDKIKELYNLGLTAVAVSEKLKISKTTVLRYIDKRKKIKLTDEEKRKNNVLAVQKRRNKIKDLSIDYKGGFCVKCGYNKCKRALEFHHLNPLEKEFGISSKGYRKSWNIIKKELDKCILVCSNCHAEIHEEMDNKIK
jgi:predicted transcriptional regulator